MNGVSEKTEPSVKRCTEESRGRLYLAGVECGGRVCIDPASLSPTADALNGAVRRSRSAWRSRGSAVVEDPLCCRGQGPLSHLREPVNKNHSDSGGSL